MYRVLVSGVGAVIGYGIIRSLAKSRHHVEIFGMDIFDNAVGRHWADSFIVAERTDAVGYAEFLERTMDDNSIDLLIPGIEQDVSFLGRYQRPPESTGVFAVNNPELTRLSDDKWLMHQALEMAGLPTIKTFKDGTFSELQVHLGQTFLLKPRRSYASKGIEIIRDEADFNYWKTKLGENFMVQEIVGSIDEEYTVAAFGYADGSCSRPIVLRRTLSGEGSTAKAWVIAENHDDYSALKIQVDQLSAQFKPVGPTNFQFRKHQEEFLLLEINARISSSTSFRTAFGYNEAEMCIDYYLEGTRPLPPPARLGEGVRFVEDMVIYASSNL